MSTPNQLSVNKKRTTKESNTCYVCRKIIKAPSSSSILKDIPDVKKLILTQKNENRQLRRQIINKLKERKTQKWKDRTNFLIKIDKLRRYFQKENDELEKERQKLRLLSKRVAYLKERMLKIEKEKQKKDRLENRLKSVRNEIAQLQKERNQQLVELSKLRRNKVGDLFSFLTLNPSRTSAIEYEIINIVLPISGDYSPVPKIVLSTALGYIVHIVSLLSYYLNEWLPYKMKYISSESIIWLDSEE
eukprot:TRINITY_DN4659_c0_g1_i2.p1 TRINITY_DN4659_c0_g1~~TRINITY_DN4659_c0_g1_i2.p1  ORF type:complete len:246 (-),score=51.19 TRINITY_DN4659_c0_g1_i2:70-807(-)